MKSKVVLLMLMSIFILAACGQKSLSEPITLLNQNQEEVNFPSEKPALFFFITTYT
jgi:uncharacterized lipoprotein YajG